MKMDEWGNVEEKLDQTIGEMMFSDPQEGFPTLGVLLGILSLPNGVPSEAKPYAQKIQELTTYPGHIRSVDEWIAKMPEDNRLELRDALLAMLRFVARRGKEL